MKNPGPMSHLGVLVEIGLLVLLEVRSTPRVRILNEVGEKAMTTIDFKHGYVHEITCPCFRGEDIVAFFHQTADCMLRTEQDG